MKTTNQRQRTRSETTVTQSSMNISIRRTRAKTPTKKLGGRQHRSTGISDTCSFEKDKHLPSKAQAFSKQHPVAGACLSETTNPAPTLQQEPGQPLQLSASIAEAFSEQLPVSRTCPPETSNPILTLKQEPGQAIKYSAKIKLQLFPIDLSTKKALEKGGYNPHLELTLSKQKKISSVLRHIKSKWGSVYSFGEVMLFPYDIQLENLAGYRRWTLEDTDINAADVYEAIGSPAIFRLRYGWFPNAEPWAMGAPLTSPGAEECLQNEKIKQSGTRDDEIVELERQPCILGNKECAPTSTSDSPNVSKDEPVVLDRADEPLDNPSAGQSLAPSSSIWADSLTNISIGGLLSEASLHAIGNQHDSVGAKSLSQQIPFSCDSFDAAIAAHIYRHSQDPQRAPNASHSSFLDAEETCHAFPCQKFASSGKDIITSSKNEVNNQNPILQKLTSKADSASRCTQETDYVSSSLGMSGINWTDSVNPFELSLSSSGRLTSGDDISLSGFLATNSVDAFQNFKVFARDLNAAAPT